MILLKGSLLLLVPQKTQCLRDQERIYEDNQQQQVSRFLAPFLVSTGKDSMNRWGSGIFACKEHFSINWFSFISLCDWFRKLAPTSQPIRCKILHRWSPPFSRDSVGWLMFSPSSHWLILVLWTSIETPLSQYQNVPITAEHTMHQWSPSGGKLESKIEKSKLQQINIEIECFTWLHYYSNGDLQSESYEHTPLHSL